MVVRKLPSLTSEASTPAMRARALLGRACTSYAVGNRAAARHDASASQKCDPGNLKAFLALSAWSQQEGNAMDTLITACKGIGAAEMIMSLPSISRSEVREYTECTVSAWLFCKALMIISKIQ